MNAIRSLSAKPALHSITFPDFFEFSGWDFSEFYEKIQKLQNIKKSSQIFTSEPIDTFWGVRYNDSQEVILDIMGKPEERNFVRSGGKKLGLWLYTRSFQGISFKTSVLMLDDRFLFGVMDVNNLLLRDELSMQAFCKLYKIKPVGPFAYQMNKEDDMLAFVDENMNTLWLEKYFTLRLYHFPTELRAES